MTEAEAGEILEDFEAGVAHLTGEAAVEANRQYAELEARLYRQVA